MLLEQSRDLRSLYVNLSYMDPASFDANKDRVVEQLEAQLKKLEAFASRRQINVGAHIYLLGELTFVDIVYTDLLEQLEALEPGLVSDHTRLLAVMSAVQCLPRIQEYKASANYVDHPYNNLSAAFR